jgi:hypothetical protein
MSEFLGLLKYLKEKNEEFVVSLNCKKIKVKVQDITGDMVTLYETDSNNRYDLHYTQIVIHGIQK